MSLLEKSMYKMTNGKRWQFEIRILLLIFLISVILENKYSVEMKMQE